MLTDGSGREGGRKGRGEERKEGGVPRSDCGRCLESRSLQEVCSHHLDTVYLLPGARRLIALSVVMATSSGGNIPGSLPFEGMQPSVGALSPFDRHKNP